MFKQSDPADFLHAALDYCHDRAPHKLEWLLELMQGTAYDREWVDRRAFPNCQVRCDPLWMAWASVKDLLEVMQQHFMYAVPRTKCFVQLPDFPFVHTGPREGLRGHAIPDAKRPHPC